MSTVLPDGDARSSLSLAYSGRVDLSVGVRRDELWWDIDGGTGDRHRICFDGEWWGTENVRPRDLHGMSAALLKGCDRWHHYVVTCMSVIEVVK